MKIQIDPQIFNAVYRPYINDYSNRYEIYYGSGGSGKSVFITQKIIYKCLSSKRKVLCIRKIGATLKQSVFQLFIDTLIDWQVYPFIKINRSYFTIEFPNGSTILCSGLDNSEKVKSIAGITDIWIEESSEITLDDFNQLDLRLRHRSVKSQQIYLSFNPVSKTNWVYNTFFNPETADRDFLDKCLILKTTYKDNRFLPDAYIESLERLKSINPTYYTIYALGEFGSLSKLIYSYEIGVVDETLKPHLELLLGLDFGFTNDPTAFTISYLDKANKTIYIDAEWGGKGFTNDIIAQHIADLGFSKSIIIADSAEQKSIEEIKRHGIYRIKPCTKGKGSILQGINTLLQYKIVVNPQCRETINELQNYSWKRDKQTNEYTNTPIDEYNHYLDALRYSLQIVEKPKLGVLDKKTLGL